MHDPSKIVTYPPCYNISSNNYVAIDVFYIYYSNATLSSFPLNLMETFTVNKITRVSVMWRFCDVAHKHSCPPRMSPLENILKRKNLFISRVRIEIILLYGELSLINA